MKAFNGRSETTDIMIGLPTKVMSPPMDCPGITTLSLSSESPQPEKQNCSMLTEKYNHLAKSNSHNLRLRVPPDASIWRNAIDELGLF